jgi:hypothetical protein
LKGRADVNKKKTGKSKAAKSVKDLPAKAANARTAKGGGGVGFTYGKVQIPYQPQKPDGTD